MNIFRQLLVSMSCCLDVLPSLRTDIQGNIWWSTKRINKCYLSLDGRIQQVKQESGLYLVLWRAAFTAKDNESNRFPPHSNTYQIKHLPQSAMV